MAQTGAPVDPKLTAVADWLRNEKRSGLTTKEAVQYEKVCCSPSAGCARARAYCWRGQACCHVRILLLARPGVLRSLAGLPVAAERVLTRLLLALSQRVEYFKGSKLVDTLMNANKYKGKVAKDMPIKTRAEAAKLAQELLRVGYIHRSQRVQHAHTRRWELELFHGPFEEDGLFTWVYEGPHRRRRCRRRCKRWQCRGMHHAHYANLVLTANRCAVGLQARRRSCTSCVRGCCWAHWGYA